MSDACPTPFCILIVDDALKNLQLLGNILKENNYEVEFALDGEKALDWIKTKPFDLILLDIMMPGMDGYELCSRIKADMTTQHIPIIFITAKTQTEDIVKGFDIGASDYITKPFMAPELLARVKKEVELKVLRGLIPICSNCKDIRDDMGSWQRIEAYVEKKSSALFSHSICPKCTKKLYGDEDWYGDPLL